jgi:hypothetical protein
MVHLYSELGRTKKSNKKPYWVTIAPVYLQKELNTSEEHIHFSHVKLKLYR